MGFNPFNPIDWVRDLLDISNSDMDTFIEEEASKLEVAEKNLKEMRVSCTDKDAISLQQEKVDMLKLHIEDLEAAKGAHGMGDIAFGTSGDTTHTTDSGFADSVDLQGYEDAW